MAKRKGAGQGSKAKRQTRWDRSTRLVKYKRAPRDPFPGRVTATMAYSTQIALNTFSAGVGAQAFIRANGIHDPEVAIGGHQPYGHDTYAQIYNHYKVLASTITCHFVGKPQANNATASHICGISLVDNTIVNDTVDEMREQQETKWGVTVPGQSVKVSNKFSAAKMFPMGHASNHNLTATLDKDPVEGAYFKVWTSGVNQNVDVNAIDIIVTVNYTVLMWERRDLGMS
jgi:hypothetical protein